MEPGKSAVIGPKSAFKTPLYNLHKTPLFQGELCLFCGSRLFHPLPAMILPPHAAPVFKVSLSTPILSFCIFISFILQKCGDFDLSHTCFYITNTTKSINPPYQNHHPEVCLDGDIDTIGSIALSVYLSCGYVKGVCAC